MTNVQVQRDGLTLRGVLEIPEGKDTYDMAILSSAPSPYFLLYMNCH